MSPCSLPLVGGDEKRRLLRALIFYPGTACPHANSEQFVYLNVCGCIQHKKKIRDGRAEGVLDVTVLSESKLKGRTEERFSILKDIVRSVS